MLRLDESLVAGTSFFLFDVDSLFSVMSCASCNARAALQNSNGSALFKMQRRLLLLQDLS
jgi:hypothetical protein